MSGFDAARLPRARLLEEAFPGQALHSSGWGKVRCTLPGCEHANGDRSPSLRVNVEGGGFECLRSGRSGRGWKDFAAAWWGEERWSELMREVFGTGPSRGRPPTLEERWSDLEPCRALPLVTRADLRELYLGRGARYPGDPVSELAFALRDSAGGLAGIKWRLPAGERWKVGSLGKRDPFAKYALTKGSNPGEVFLGHLVTDSATLVVCAGEKDALVAASHLEPADWAPVSGSYGEGKPPAGLREIARGRRVVVAYDGDRAGQEGAWRVCLMLGRVASSLRVAFLPEDTPPGKDRPGWDVAEVVEHQGPERLRRLLESAGPIPEEWAPKKGPAAAPSAPAGPPPLPPGGDPLDDGPPDEEPEERVEFALSDWGEVSPGMVVRYVARGRGEKRREVAVCQFRGRPRVAEVRSVLTEDPGEPRGWAESEEVLYRFELPDGAPPLERVAPAGRDAFGELLDSTRLAAATEVGRRDLWKLHLWTIQQSRWRERREVRAVGPHGDLGWLSPGGYRVRGGEVEAVDFLVGPPTEAEEFKRYRLAVAPEGMLREAARWVVDELLCCDHNGQAYALPMLGFVMAAPLWEYLPTLASWQRAAAFIQGPSGTGKSQFVRYFLSFWGDFTSGEGLTTWKSSATYIEELMHHAKGVPLCVGDFKRSNLRGEKMDEAKGLLQAYADRTARGRAGRGGSKAERKRPPRCCLILDGEDLPEGEESILGRLVILKVRGHGETGRCATAQEDTLDPAMVATLPALTARWIAWVERNARGLDRRLPALVAELDGIATGKSSNRSRVVRSYAVQELAVEAFLAFLESLGAMAPLTYQRSKAREVHVAMLEEQLRLVAGESAAELFLRTLSVLLASGQLNVGAEEGTSGIEPYMDSGRVVRNSQCVGTYHRGVANIWPDVAIPAVNRHLRQGGGDAIAFSRGAIQTQLETAGLILGTPRKRVSSYGHPTAGRIYTWAISLHELGGRCSAEASEREAG